MQAQHHSLWFEKLTFTKEEADRVEVKTVMLATCKARETLKHCNQNNHVRD